MGAAGPVVVLGDLVPGVWSRPPVTERIIKRRYPCCGGRARFPAGARDGKRPCPRCGLVWHVAVRPSRAVAGAVVLDWRVEVTNRD